MNHLKRIIFVFTLCVVSIFTNCSKRSDLKPQKKDEPRFRITKETHPGTERYFFYSTVGQLERTEIFREGKITDVSRYYYENGKHKRSEQYEYSYNTGVPVARLINVDEYTYNTDSFPELITSYSGRMSPFMRTEFTFENKQLKEVTISLYDSGTSKWTIYTKEEINASVSGNVEKVIKRGYNQDGNILNESTTEYSYDDKINPGFKQSYPLNYQYYFSPANVVKVIRNGITYNQGYDYNDYGYPVKTYDIFSNGDKKLIVTTEYEEY